ncbi:MAG: leucine-rich repeat protein, partial [Monoglobaceae bacterium]
GEAFVIPASVESIGDSAFVNDFRDNNKVKSVIFAKGSKLTSVGKAVFQHCSNLTEVEIPASVTTMNANALNDCSADVYFEGSVSSTSDFSTMFNKANKVYYYDDAMTSKLVRLAEGVTVTKLPLAVKAATSVSVDDTEITASVKYRAPQNMTASQSYVLILAQYDEDGALVGVDLSKAGSIEADTTQYEVPIETTVEKASDYASCKAFLWDGLNTLKSLATAE